MDILSQFECIFKSHRKENEKSIEGEQEYLERYFKGLDGCLTDERWDSLSPEAQSFYNDTILAIKEHRVLSPIPEASKYKGHYPLSLLTIGDKVELSTISQGIVSGRVTEFRQNSLTVVEELSGQVDVDYNSIDIVQKFDDIETNTARQARNEVTLFAEKGNTGFPIQFGISEYENQAKIIEEEANRVIEALAKPVENTIENTSSVTKLAAMEAELDAVKQFLSETNVKDSTKAKLEALIKDKRPIAPNVISNSRKKAGRKRKMDTLSPANEWLRKVIKEHSVNPDVKFAEIFPSFNSEHPLFSDTTAYTLFNTTLKVLLLKKEIDNGSNRSGNAGADKEV